MKTREYIKEVFKGELISEEIVKFVFGSLALLGSLLIFLLSFVPSGAGDVGMLILKFLVPLGIMGTYWFWFSQRNETESHQYAFADSFYYMGFIYTLVALLGSFLSGVLIGGSLDTNALIGNLGIALSTTIFGLGVRVYIVSFEPSSDVTQKEIQRNLTASSIALSSKINTIVNRLSDLEQRSFSSLGNRTDALALSFGSATSHSEALTQSIIEVQDTMDTATRSGAAFKKALDGTTRASDAFTTSTELAAVNARDLAEAEASLAGVVRNAAQTLNTAFDKANTLIESELEAALARLNDHFTNLIQSYVEASQTSIGNFAQGVAEADARLRDVSVGIASAAEKIRGGSAELTGAIDAFKQNIGSSSEALNRQRESLTRITNAMAEINASMQTFAENFKKTTDLSGQLETVATGLQTVNEVIATIANADLSGAQTAAIEKLAASSQQFVDAISGLTVFAAKVEEYGVESTALIRLTQDALVENLARTRDRIEN